MVEAGGFDSNQSLAWFQRRQFLHADLNHIRTADPERPGNQALSRLIHDRSSYYPTWYGGAG
jgi:hypothetical protein